MKTLKIEIPKGHEIDTEKSTFEKIVFKELTNKYPLNIEDVKGRDWAVNTIGELSNYIDSDDSNQLSSEKRARAFLALMQLVELRDAWNKIDGGIEWVYGNINHTISNCDNRIGKNDLTFMYKVLHFRKEETRDLFLETFKDLINEAKELI